MDTTRHRPRLATTTSSRANGYGVGLVVADQATKFLAENTQGCGPVICPLRNDSLMLGVGGGSSVNVAIVGCGGLAVFFVWVWACSRRAALPSSAVALVVAGVAANMVDRILFGSVRDFLSVPGNAVINLADVGIFVGLVACTVAAFRANPGER